MLVVDGVIHRLARPVDERLAWLLTENGVAVRTGKVLLACDAAHLAVDAIHQLWCSTRKRPHRTRQAAQRVWFTITPRTTEHVRHQHKYTDTDLPHHRGFHFRTDRGPTGVVALNLRQFVAHLRHCDSAELHHHATGRDLSRWIRDVHRDQPLADRLVRLEGRIAAGADPDTERADIVAMVEHRYGLGAVPR